MAIQNLAKGLAIRGLIIDARVLRRLPGEELAERVDSSLGGRQTTELLNSEGHAWARGLVKGMLGSEIREELTKRGVSDIGERWELEASLAQLMAEDSSQAAAPPAARPSAHESMVNRVDAEARRGAAFAPDSAEGIRAKYAAALETKRAMGAARGAGVGAAAAFTQATGERSGWELQPGVKDFLHYLDMRGMARALLPMLPSEADHVDGDSQGSGACDEGGVHDRAGSEGAALAQQLQVPPFTHVLGTSGAAGVRWSEGACVLAACAAMGLPPGNVMLVSDQAQALRAARYANALSCYVVKQIAGAPQRLPSDMVAHDMASLRGAVEELNGHSFRDS